MSTIFKLFRRIQAQNEPRLRVEAIGRLSEKMLDKTSSFALRLSPSMQSNGFKQNCMNLKSPDPGLALSALLLLDKVVAADTESTQHFPEHAQNTAFLMSLFPICDRSLIALVKVRIWLASKQFCGRCTG